MKILLLGSGAREHALARALASDPATTELVVAPGNPGTAAIATNISADANDPDAWAAEMEDTEEYFKKFGDKVPAAVTEQLAKFRERIAKAKKA